MADLSKLKTRRNSLGDPPPPEAAGKNLLAPEIAPAADDANNAEQLQTGQSVVQLRPAIAPPAPSALEVDASEEPPKRRPEERAKKALSQVDGTKEPPRKKRIDGRTLRKTGRTVPLSLHVTAAFDDRLRAIATRDGLLFSVLLERALEAYEATKAK